MGPWSAIVGLAEPVAGDQGLDGDSVGDFAGAASEDLARGIGAGAGRRRAVNHGDAGGHLLGAFPGSGGQRTVGRGQAGRGLALVGLA